VTAGNYHAAPLKTGNVTAGVPNPALNESYGIAISKDGKTAYVAQYQTLQVIDSASGANTLLHTSHRGFIVGVALAHDS
jgi:DNA-binding beta-propeller fold protein YncE